MSSFVSSIKSAVTGGNDNDKTTNPDQSSNSDKLVAENAASDKTNIQKVAGAAADVVVSAKEYGKFDESQGVGQYLKKTDDYLREYEKSGGGATAAPPVTEEKKAHAPPPVEEKKEETGVAGAFKAAGNLFK